LFVAVGGYRLLYDRKCPFTLHVVDDELIEKVGHTITQAEDLRVKILLKVSSLISKRLAGKYDFGLCAGTRRKP